MPLPGCGNAECSEPIIDRRTPVAIADEGKRESPDSPIRLNDNVQDVRAGATEFVFTPSLTLSFKKQKRSFR